MRIIVIGTLTGFLSLGCGSDTGGSNVSEAVGEGEVSEQNSEEIPEKEVAAGDNGDFAKLVATTADLPACDENSRGHLMFVSDLSKFMVCETEWREINLSGKDGVDGENGADGKEGISVDKQSAWFTTDLNASPELCEGIDCTGVFRVSGIHVTYFTSETALIEVSAHFLDSDESGDTEKLDIGHSVFVNFESDGSATFARKVNSYSNTLYYLIIDKLKNQVVIVLDGDGDVTNNFGQVYDLIDWVE